MPTATDPEAAYQLNDLGNTLSDRREFPAAIDAYRKAITLMPNFAAAHSNLGAALRDAGQIDESLIEHRRAVELNPRSPAALNNLGVALTDAGWFADAITVFRAAIAYDPKYAEAWTNLAVALLSTKDATSAIAAGRRAIEIDSTLAKAQMNLAIILFSTGHLREAFARHEWRFKCHWHFKQRQLDKPIWDGSAMPGDTLLVHAEQGFGDTIHFVRYVKRARALCRRVVMEVHPELARLLGDHADEVISRGQPLPAFDAHCSMMSLPAILDLDSHDTSVYIHARPKLVSSWADRLKHLRLPRIGICHRGRPAHSNDQNRSMPFEAARELVNRNDVALINLRKWDDFTPPLGVDFTDDLHDFADTAALIANLDAVVTVDTAVAHLAGAMGKPCWIMLPYVAEWRWLIDRHDSPWYASARLFRQSKFGNWTDVVRAVSESLDQLHDRNRTETTL